MLRIRWAIGSISQIEQRPPCELKKALTQNHGNKSLYLNYDWVALNHLNRLGNAHQLWLCKSCEQAKDVKLATTGMQ